jgi:hypothetical protein
MTDTMFAHSLLFQCEACNGPIAISVASSDRGLEAVDGTSLRVACGCGWVENLMGVNARRHWVVRWPVPTKGDGLAELHGEYEETEAARPSGE